MSASLDSGMVPEGAAGWRHSWDRYLAALLVLAAFAWLVHSGEGRLMWRGYWAQRHLRAGLEALRAAQPRAAERHFAAAQTMASRGQNVAATTALAYLAYGLPDAARPYLKAALESTRDPLLLAAVGNELLQSGLRADAEAAFARALEAGKSDAEVLNTVGYAYAVAGVELPRAETLLKEALELQPRAPHIVDSLGWVYFKMGRFEQAVPLLEQAARAMPGNPEVLEHLRAARRALHQQQAASGQGARPGK